MRNDHLPATTEVVEINASSKAYPPWWSEMEESRTLRRRKSMGDVVIERNICFIDTPGWDEQDVGDGMDNSGVQVLGRVEGLLRQSSTMGNMSDSELLNVLSGGGGPQVDVVLYMFDPSK